MSVRSTLALTALVTLTAPAGAQASPWATLALPQGVLASALDGQGKLVTYRDGTTLHVFSSVTRRWHATSVSATADVRLFNDCLLVVEPGYCRAFASHADAFVDVPRGPGASVLNDGSHKNDSIVLVADNGLLRAFSGFTGAWTTRALGANWAADVQRHVAVLADGGTLAGMSAFGGGWHDLPIAGTAAWLTADGSTALATEGAWVHGFSAHTSTWSSAPAIPSATFVRGDDWGLFYGSGRVLAYSGLRGSFAAIEHTVTGVAGASGEGVAECAELLVELMTSACSRSCPSQRASRRGPR